MKKLLIIVLCIVLTFSVAACKPESPQGGIGVAITDDPDNSVSDTTDKADTTEEVTEEDLKGNVKKIEITMDNWDDYFEFDYTDYTYLDGPGGKIIKIGAHHSITLKDGYRIVLDRKECHTSVRFEAGIKYYFSYVNYDFEEGTWSFGDPSHNNDISYKNESVVFDNECCELNIKRAPKGVRTVGQGWQGDVKDGTVQHEQLCEIHSIIAAEGTLYVYID